MSKFSFWMIASFKKVMSDYKVKIKSNWKTFKNTMNYDIDKIEKSLGKLTKNKKEINAQYLFH